ncbi:methyltransferase domain-containing protein [Mastigocladus laminosus UU774]|nr:methyltransferase domain-containing protein [Mastigocladus laminosus UU774]
MNKINIDELMEKIREEVAQRKFQQSQLQAIPSANSSNSNNNNIEISAIKWAINHIEALLKNAESRAVLRTKWPDNLNKFPFNFSRGLQNIALKILNFIFKDQREVNFNVINALKESVALNQQIVAQISVLRSQLDERLIAVENRLQELDGHLNVVNSSFQKVDHNFNKIDIQTNSWINDIQKHLDAVNKQMQGINEHLVSVDSRVGGLGQRLSTVDFRVEGLDQRLNAVDSRLKELSERYMINENYIKTDIWQQKRLITLFLEEARQRLPEPLNQQQLETFVNEENHLLDAFYVAFENQFRGSRDDILNRLKVYLPFIAEAKIGESHSPILDVGCGRGEWLELLQNNNYTARGLDINRVMLEQCRSRGLEVIEADVISYLNSLSENSLGAITGFHIIEHLPFQILMKLFTETVRVLRPGGLVIFETPNPENILVASHNFYTDPTHRNPLPSTTVKFIAESVGLCRVNIMKLHPYTENFKIDDSELAERLNDLFYGPQDYAVIGYKNDL